MFDERIPLVTMSIEQNDATTSVYGLLARLWLNEVDDKLLASLTTGELAARWETICHRRSAIHDSSLDELAVEYCLLFVAPSPQISPYQSVWEEQQLSGKSTTSMDRFVELIQPAMRTWGDTLSDHLGVQLAVMGMFSALENESLAATNNDETHQPIENLPRQFFATHLAWSERFMTQARQLELPGFYGELVEVTKAFLDSERSRYA